MIALHTSKLTPLGGRRFALDASIGARWHSVDGGGKRMSKPKMKPQQAKGAAQTEGQGKPAPKKVVPKRKR